eukprot:364459-Chlamydomonas_euryale.AAC.1
MANVDNTVSFCPLTYSKPAAACGCQTMMHMRRPPPGCAWTVVGRWQQPGVHSPSAVNAAAASACGAADCVDALHSASMAGLQLCADYDRARASQPCAHTCRLLAALKTHR